MMIDHFSIGHASQALALAAIDAVQAQGAVEIDGPFRIVVTVDPGDDLASPAVAPIIHSDGLIYFNARSTAPLPGDWQAAPATPFRIWA